MGRPTKEQAEIKQRAMTANMRAYAIWMATPEGIRKPVTKKEFAERIGVSETMLWNYSKDPRIAEAIRFLVLQNAGNPENILDVLNMIKEVAMEKKSVSAGEVWLKATGVMSQFGRGGSSVLDVVDDLQEDNFTNYSDEELAELREMALAQQAEQEAMVRARQALADTDAE